MPSFFEHIKDIYNTNFMPPKGMRFPNLWYITSTK